MSDKEQLPLLNRKAPFLGVTNALLVLMVVCFLVPFALRGSRTAMENMQNDVKNWLPSDYPETQELNWFGKHFMGEQFIVVTWEGCNESDESYQAFFSAASGPDALRLRGLRWPTRRRLSGITGQSLNLA